MKIGIFKSQPSTNNTMVFPKLGEIILKEFHKGNLSLR